MQPSFWLIFNQYQYRIGTVLVTTTQNLVLFVQIVVSAIGTVSSFASAAQNFLRMKATAIRTPSPKKQKKQESQ